ncbi:dihydroorotase [Halosquirtibacter xylanolyticus]|uniref:dihydroorotase n=1 Tax=Halosquirtibacter xylanolyticus TaxID=3374599 RepID=UPI003749E673|nr:dihydroorotase [Prolixibacteraceae bacterium]
MKTTLITNVKIVNEGKIHKKCSVLIKGDTIEKIFRNEVPQNIIDKCEVLDGDNRYLIPGVIDDQVHLREPGLTHKEDIYHGSRAAVAGGVTSFMEMPNTIPQATDLKTLEEKYDIAANSSLANYSFYLGATNTNIEEVEKVDKKNICGVKLFMGSSTGNMLVDNEEALNLLFAKSPVIITSHCEDEQIIRENIAKAKEQYGENVPISEHPKIRSAEACYQSTVKTIELAKKHNARLHVLHLSTQKEMSLFQSGDLKNKNITSEVCVHHLWFDDSDYEKYGTKIKWNPAIKAASDKAALWEALNNDRIDVVATDHAPHTAEEKDNNYFKAPSGGPLLQHSLVAMLDMARKGNTTIEKVVEKMCHAPADLFEVEKRGYIRKGYKADIVLVDQVPWEATSENTVYKCGWSPFEGTRFAFKVTHTFVNGELVYKADKEGMHFYEENRGQRLTFDRE